MFSRALLVSFICFAVAAVSILGLNSGMVLRVDDHGHLALENPRAEHAHAHAAGADHGPGDMGADADHEDLHDLIAEVSEFSVGTQKVDRSVSDLADAHQTVATFEMCLSAPLVPLLGASDGLNEAAATLRGGTAHSALSSLRTIVLIV
jgi:hypothetical protein